MNIRSVQFSPSVVFDPLRPYGMQHARPPCPSPTPRVYSNSCPVMPSNHLFLCCPLHLLPSIFPSIRVFSSQSVICVRWPKYWSFNVNISPSNEYSGLIFIGLTGLICWQSMGLSRVFSNTTVQNYRFVFSQFLYDPIVTSIHDHWKNHSLD